MLRNDRARLQRSPSFLRPLLLEQRCHNRSLSFERQDHQRKFTEAKKERRMRPKKRTPKPSLKAIEAGAKAMAPSGAVSDLKAWNGRNDTAAELELIERRETNKPKLGIKR
jgi:hypothetical protein